MQNVETAWHIHTQAMAELDECIEEENEHLKKIFKEEDWIPSNWIEKKKKLKKKYIKNI